uniref:Uncharacterized protein n=1 Tax=Timema bartmani TaxID=61472 RepID=A0A7R9HXB2_9NEOP|nr:unnamed protein product [Timema bartmani]
MFDEQSKLRMRDLRIFSTLAKSPIHGVGVEFIRILPETHTPQLTNLFCECAPNDDVVNPTESTRIRAISSEWPPSVASVSDTICGQKLLICPHEAELTPFQTHNFTEKSEIAGDRTQDLWIGH